MDTETAVKLINRYGGKRIPFFFLIDFEQREIVVTPLHEIKPGQIRIEFTGFSNAGPPEIIEPLKLEKIPTPYADYVRKFNQVLAYLKKGDSYLVNLTAKTQVSTNLDLHQIFYYAKAPYKVLLNNRFVSFSPETFVKINNGIISTFPMKGTARASDPVALQELVNNKKELAEHITVVDLLRNDLSHVANQVQVTDFRFPTYIISDTGNLVHLSTRIEGHLPEDFHKQLGTIIFNMLPAGSVSGAPKTRTSEIISQVEGEKRGYYTGISGIFDGTNLDSCVLIRFIELCNGKFYFRSGGGITTSSLPEIEYQEMIDKVYVPVA